VKLSRKVAGIVGALILGMGGAVAVAAPASAGTYVHVAVHASSLCLDVPGFSTAPGEQVTLYQCNGGSNQAFLFEDAGYDFAYFVHPMHNRSMCLVPGNASLADSTIIQWPCNRGIRQTWVLGASATYPGMVVMQNSYSMMCAGVDFAYSSAYVRQNSCASFYRLWSLP
jgi:hypothetical protein